MAKFKKGDKVIKNGYPDEILTIVNASADGALICFDTLDKPYSKVYNSLAFTLYKEAKMEQPPKKTPHKHAKMIKAWADGAKIQVRPPTLGRLYNPWVDINMDSYTWSYDLEYQIKPEPEPDTILYADMRLGQGCLLTDMKRKYTNIKLTFDGETKKLKSAEVISS